MQLAIDLLAVLKGGLGSAMSIFLLNRRSSSCKVSIPLYTLYVSSIFASDLSWNTQQIYDPAFVEVKVFEKASLKK